MGLKAQWAVTDFQPMAPRAAWRARAAVRRDRRQAVRANLGLLLLGLLVMVVLAVLGFFQPLPLPVLTFELGVLVAGGAAALAWLVHLASGVHGRHLGIMGEEFTAKAVASWRRRRRGWKVLNGLFFASHGDVDHALVGPGGVFVLESKWSSAPLRVDEGGVTGIAGRDPIAQARRGARKVEMLLNYGHDRIGVPVQPVVVLWGPGAPALPSGAVEVSGVIVCEGRRQRQWLRQLDSNGRALSLADVGRAERALQHLLDRQAAAA